MVVDCSLFCVRCLLFVACWSLFVVCCSLFVMSCLVLFRMSSLFDVCCSLLLIARCVLVVVCCLVWRCVLFNVVGVLPVVRWLLFAVRR